jgi:outer membrane protein assembly factor BamB
VPNEERITRIIHRPGRGILAADTRGAVHWFTADLERRRSSRYAVAAQDPVGDPIYAIAVAGDAIITRDRIGNISRWDADTLALTDRLDAWATVNRDLLLDGEQPTPTTLRGIGIWQGKAYVDNGYFQVVVIDLAGFTVDRIVAWPHGYDMLEWFCTEAPGIHAVGDRHGQVHLGSLPELAFPTVVQIDTSNVHRVLYDERHGRLWALTDAGIDETRRIANGVVTMTLDGTVEQRMAFAGNDVEGLAFAPDFSRAYCGGFDGELLIFDNSTRQLTVAARIRGFSHQIIDVTVGDGRVYVLTQDGEVTALDPDGRFLGRLNYPRQCVWDLQPVPGEDGTLLAATDDGVALVRLLEPAAGPAGLSLVDRHPDAPGFTRRLVVTDDGWVALCWPGTVRRVRADGQLLWERKLPGIAHTLARSPDGSRLLVACNAGGIELDAATGGVTSRIEGLPASAWASAYLADGQRLLATRNGVLNAYTETGVVTWSAQLGDDYPKRLFVDGDRVRVTGGGGVKEFVVGRDQPERRFSALLDNTAENCVVIDGMVCTITYGLQLAVYDHTTAEMLALREDLPDFPKGLAAVRGADGDAYLVLGGRGGYLRLYRLDRGGSELLTLLRDLWLPPSAPGYPSVAEAEAEAVARAAAAEAEATPEVARR